MEKTKKKFLLIALLSIVAMLCCGLALLFTPTSTSVNTNTNLTVKADPTYYVGGNVTNNVSSYIIENGLIMTDDHGQMVIWGYTSDISPTLTFTSGQLLLYAGCFANCTTITSVTIQSGVVIQVGTDVFRGCENLETFVNQGTGFYVNEEMFTGCIKLTYVDLGVVSSGVDSYNSSIDNLEVLIVRNTECVDNLSILIPQAPEGGPVDGFSLYVDSSCKDEYESALSGIVAAANIHNLSVAPPSPVQTVIPETGIALDIILPSTIIGLVALATIIVWKKKEY